MTVHLAVLQEMYLLSLASFCQSRADTYQVQFMKLGSRVYITNFLIMFFLNLQLQSQISYFKLKWKINADVNLQYCWIRGSKENLFILVLFKGVRLRILDKNYISMIEKKTGLHFCLSSFFFLGAGRLKNLLDFFFDISSHLKKGIIWKRLS